jgi:hypothetical protein
VIRYATLQEGLEDVHAYEVDEHHNELAEGGLTAILGWWAVDTGESCTSAYFATQHQALGYRLTIINARLNPLNQPFCEEVA